MSSISKTLHQILSTIEQDGDFATQGKLAEAAPLIKIEGVGYPGYPITAQSAAKLKNVASKAPYGRGEETLLDESVRRSWQVTPEELEFEEGWQKKLQHILKAACKGLGVEGKVEATLYKLLYYERGGFFTRHRDSEKQDRMFATLVVALPCEHEGGVLEVRHLERSIRLDLSSVALDEIKWAAFYTDCEHELHPVTSGARVVLLYNLYRVGRRAVPTPQQPLIEAQEQLHALCCDWAKQTRKSRSKTPPPDRLIIPLAHEYSLAGLLASDLKGRDREAATALYAACKRTGFEMFLGVASIEESGGAINQGGGYNRWYEEEDEDEFEVDEVYASVRRVLSLRSFEETRPRAKPLIESVAIKEGELCPPDALDQALEDSVMFHEATGNEGASFERSYRHAAIVIWPAAHTLDLVSEGELSSSLGVFNMLARRKDIAEDPGALLERALDHWLKELERSSSWKPEGFDPGALLAILRSHANATSMERFFTEANLDQFYANHEDQLAELLATLDAHALRRILDTRMARHLPDELSQALHWIELLLHPALDPVDAIEGVCEHILASFSKGLPTELDEGWYRWRSEVQSAWKTRAPVEQTTRLLQALIREDGAREQSVAIVMKMANHPEVYAMRDALIPALLNLHKVYPACTAPALVALHRASLAWCVARASQVPTPPGDWQRAFKRCDDSSCKDCKEIQDFMRDPEREHMLLAASKARREHARSMLARWECTCEMINRGNPHKLSITKNQRFYEAARALHERDSAHLVELQKITWS